MEQEAEFIEWTLGLISKVDDLDFSDLHCFEKIDELKTNMLYLLNKELRRNCREFLTPPKEK